MMLGWPRQDLSFAAVRLMSLTIMLHVFSILSEPLTLLLIAFAVEYKSPYFLFISFRECTHKITHPPAITAPGP